MKVLILGSGGREHALAWRLSQDEAVQATYVFPGNPGMALTPGLQLLHSEQHDFDSVLKLVQKNQISLVVIGPEKYLFEGWVNQFQKQGIPAFGPTAEASFLEASKIRSKIFMRENNIPTAAFEVTRTLAEAMQAIHHHPEWKGYALKLSGPALGKGVIVTHNQNEAQIAAQDFYQHQPPGIEDGMLVEECISGREVSLFYICMSDQYQLLASACDHKRLLDRDQGPNTGGMGAYSPATWFDETLLKSAEERFVIPTLKGMIKEGTPFQGILFLGIMVVPDHPSGEKLFLLEYNTRFGDPETQTFLPLLEGDFAQLLLAVATSSTELFKKNKLTLKNKSAVHVVKAAKGYPGLFGEKIETGQIIQVSDSLKAPASDAFLFFAGVKKEKLDLLSGGGRVLGITALASDQRQARKLAYQKLSEVHFQNEQFRSDIGGQS